MDVRLEKDGPAIGSPVEMIHSFSCAMQTRQAQWEHRLRDQPGDLREVQGEMQQHFQEGAELLTASLLAQVTQQPEMEGHVQRMRQESVVPLRAPERRPLQLRVGALVVWLSVLYCPPQRKGPAQAADQEQRVGLYPELAALGMSAAIKN